MHKHMLTCCCVLAFGIGYLFSGFTQVLGVTSPVIPIALVLTLGLTCRASWLAMEAEVDERVALQRRVRRHHPAR